MKKLVIALLFALVASAMTSDTASAQQPNSFGFLPFGFYQPYGATFSNNIRTPPYFATNPPVYYGARHARPYGFSPFAAPPLVLPGSDYHSRLRSQFEQPRVPTPGPSYVDPPCCVSHSQSVTSPLTMTSVPAKIGEVRTNPFVENIEGRVAQN